MEGDDTLLQTQSSSGEKSVEDESTQSPKDPVNAGEVKKKTRKKRVVKAPKVPEKLTGQRNVKRDMYRLRMSGAVSVRVCTVQDRAVVHPWSSMAGYWVYRAGSDGGASPGTAEEAATPSREDPGVSTPEMP